MPTETVPRSGQNKHPKNKKAPRRMPFRLICESDQAAEEMNFTASPKV